ncbi:MAG: DoxX family membrane protein [Bacteroidales bacterium]|nr:DoxX family membrane protein [Bacteroidales bacterium]
MKLKDIILLILRLLIGGLFITTAIMKLVSIDEFEAYIYSFGIFNFLLSTVVARLVIMAELLLGICLMAKLLYKYAWRLTMLMLVGFTLFLIYVAVFRNDSNCHCFGDIIELDPLHSILKNVITIILMFLIRKEEDYQFKGKKWAVIAAFAVSFIVPFCVVPMDAVYNKFVSPVDEVNVNAFNKILSDSTMADFDIHDGNYVVAVYASGCKYCKMSAKRMSLMMDKHAIDPSRFQLLIWGDSTHIQHFREETQCERYPWHHINPYAAIEVVYGKFPTFILTHDGQVKMGIDYRGMDENTLREHLLQ